MSSFQGPRLGGKLIPTTRRGYRELSRLLKKSALGAAYI